LNIYQQAFSEYRDKTMAQKKRTLTT